MRKVAVAVLAVPVIVLLYLPLILRRSVASRIALVLGVAGFAGLGVIGLGGPTGTTATPPSVAIPVTSAAVRTDLRVGQAPNAAIAIAFSTPMNETSVAGSLRVEPSTTVDLAWNAERTVLTVSPTTSWVTGTFYTVSVEPGALADTGRPLSRPTRAAFLVREATRAHIAAISATKSQASLTDGFMVTFDHPIAGTSIVGALQVEPAVIGTLEPLQAAGGISGFILHPATPLTPDTMYRLSIASGLLDADGAVVAPMKPVAIRTVAAPAVVRFRPRNGADDVERSTNVSVRFNAKMDRSSTKAAFQVTVGGQPIKGRVSFAENDTVLVFDPQSAFAYGAKVTVTVSATAHSASGTPIATAETGSFTTIKKVKTAAKAVTRQISRSGGSVGGGSWAAVESYYLRLMNCTRTGGWVTSTGSCSSPGGRNVAALRLDSGISSHVSRPYAKLLATRGLCSHFVGGNPGDRLRRAGYTSYIWAENLGCRSGNPYSAVLGSHLFFQSERSYNGGHYVNLMNSKYNRAGIGVWVSSGRVRLVVDFYHSL